MFGFNGWGGRTAIGTLIRVTSEDDCNRVGSCWMSGRLKVGDLLLCVAHSGDFFYDYILVDVYHNGLQGFPGARFGAYELGKPLHWQPNPEQVNALLEGEVVRTTAVCQELSALADAEMLSRLQAILNLGQGSIVEMPQVYGSEIDGFSGLMGVVLQNDLANSEKPGLLTMFKGQQAFIPSAVAVKMKVIQA